MKRISFLLLVLFAMMLSCKREEVPQVIEYSMKEVVAEPSYTTCTITCKNEGVDDTSIHAKLLIALHEDLSDAEDFPMRLIDGKLTYQLSGLRQNTLYYYGFEVFTTADNYRFKEVHSFKTLTSTELRVETAEIVNIGQTSAMGGGNVIGGEDVAVNERGVCWSTNHNPTIDGDHLSNGYGLGEFEVNIRELLPGTRYYVRAYAKSAQRIVYGDEKSFTTVAVALPVLTTELVTFITHNSALGRGTVVNEGSSPVTERGICWSTNHNPTTNDSNLANGQGMGVYTVNMTNLAVNTTYYVRAYAINSIGTSYGNEVSFTTLSNSSVPRVTTSQVTNITQTTAVCGGNVTDDGGSMVTERGICWSIYHSPTVSGNHASNGAGTGSYYVNMNNLTPNTTYYVRAYAVNAHGTSYGNEESFTTDVAPTEWPNGKLPGVFSVSNTSKVQFSQGNLQYQASTDTWRFASNQYDYMGNANDNISHTYNGWIDLFGWGTSGWNSGNVFYEPWDDNYDFGSDELYGPPGLHDLTGSYANADWGVYNAISNGGNASNMWRTLSQSEWIYMFNTRITSSGIRYAKAQVNNIKGVILLPDNWSENIYGFNYANDGTASFNSNVINTTQWIALENAGAVFLPASGYRFEFYAAFVGVRGHYWSTTADSEISACVLSFENDMVQLLQGPESYCDMRHYGNSVRLVKNY